MKPRKTAVKKPEAIAKKESTVSSEKPKKASASAAAPKKAATKKKAVVINPSAVKKAAAKKTPAPKKAAVKLPAILLEDDTTPPPSISGPGQRYFLGADEPNAGLGELPEAYGTGKLILAARDPHWLYAAWDLTREQQKEYNGKSRDKHLVVRVYKNKVGGKPYSETHVHPESKHWFVHVGKGGTRFVAELGYYDAKGTWSSVSESRPTLTPPDTLSDDTTAKFTSLPVEVPFQKLIDVVKSELPANVPLLEAVEQLRAEGHTELPPIKTISKGTWTPKQQEALAAIVSMDSVKRIWIGSLEITELIRRKLVNELASAAAAQFSLPGAGAGEAGALGGLGSVSSPFGGMEQSKGFWFNVNAELIIYGATEPTAEVTIGGKVIKLRPDGSFSYRFALPDGDYDLPAVAVSADKSEARHAELKFNRHTQYFGDVGTHPQDPSLQPPTPDAVE